MRNAIVATGLALAGVIHLLPLPGVLGAAMLQRLYGIAIDDPDLLLLLRHRAVLFGLLAVLLFGAIRIRAWRTPALVAGIVSTAAFLLLAIGDVHGAAVQRVIAADVVALIGLLAAAAAHATERARHARAG